MGLLPISCIGVVLAAALLIVPAQAQPTPSGSQPQNQQQPVKQPQATPQGVPDPYKLNMLIRSSIIALNNANKTGNYTVLQDLGAPAFRASNNTARLAQIFAGLRRGGRDLTPILFFQPKLVSKPVIGPNGVLRLTGYFETKPERVNFDLYFQRLQGDWRIFGIGVTTSRAAVTAAIPPQAQKPKQKPVPKKTQPVSRRATAAAPPPARKPKAPAKPEKTSSKNGGGAVENRTTNNAVRIDLSAPQPSEADPAENNATTENKANGGFWTGLNPFATD